MKDSKLSADEKYNVIFELETKKAQFNNALAEALGLVRCGHHGAGKGTQSSLWAMFMGDPDTTRVVIPGQKLGVKVHVVSQSSRAGQA